MMPQYSSILTIFGLICVLFLFSTNATEQNNSQIYIVHCEFPSGERTSKYQDLESWYLSFLPATTSDSSREAPRLIYSYRNVLTGFAAKLSQEDIKEMEKMEGFVSARPQRLLKLHTTHSVDFLGLQQNMGFWKDSNYGKGVIIGVIDSGVFPDHPSFSDVGMPPIPAKWKGVCESDFATKCNNKLIGARSYQIANGSPIDNDGHGTHTAGTTAGAFVEGANVYGNANGTAVGVAPLAHIAIYKVCNSNSCSDSDILAAMDSAIDDGVDILSMSLGGSPVPFYEDSIAFGAYAATERGILVSCSAGNSGPSYITASNTAPWILTVGASTIDRKIKATVTLGNTEEFEGESAYRPQISDSTYFTLYDAAKSIGDPSETPYCKPGSLTDPAIKGKIAICQAGVVSNIEKGQAVKDAGGVGMIVINPSQYGVTKSADAHVLPALVVSAADGSKILDYTNSISNPIATITIQGTVIGDKNAPIVAAFSSRGPSKPNPGILKPDIIGPGVNILAAWPTSVDDNKDTKSTFNIISGTSMSCPHLSGIAALLKSTHPDWSPAAIKSAIMTTAYTLNLDSSPILDERLLPADIFAIGAGHVNPSSANDPGLVYDTPSEDYFPYLCGLGYTNAQVSSLLRRTVNCLEVNSIPEAQLNYPSFSIYGLGSTPQTYTRTVTNVGDATSSYKVKIASLIGVAVEVVPTELNFSELNQKLTYQVTFSKTTSSSEVVVVEGFLKWTSTRHSVRSPIAVVLV
ncbi:subtilisin-like protease 4 [Solanum lycopersicum]|uniref:subtilisin-like protease 4 n=1 Tax=Solanum lycopersicum TaxID=4081 RepID=UPI000276B50D|nr:subtilisin-like protease SBT1.7 [Solanum lycopersicum]